MGKKITDEKIIEINEVYLQCGVKSQTAKICGVSPASVTKYLIPNYVSQKERVEVTFDKPIPGAAILIEHITAAGQALGLPATAALCAICKVSPKEWEEVAKIQKGVMI